MNIKPTSLSGTVIRLEPLSEAHIPDLALAGQDPEIWRYMLYGAICDQADMRAWVEDMLARQQRGADLPFVVILQSNGHAVGATRYLNIDRPNRTLEIGGTWYAPAVQRTAVNTECKYLLLQHAFEVLACVRVQFKTDSRNLRSQHAIERLGAVKEGVLRHHMITPEGFLRDSVYYSIIDSEWPSVKTHLQTLLAGGHT
jgi:N-acetyltransferase